jgi:hypothetical protein
MMYILTLIVSSSREPYLVVTGSNVYQVTTEALCRDPQLLAFKQATIHCVQMLAFSPLLKIFHFHKMMYDRCSWNNSLIAYEVMKVLTFLFSQSWNWAMYTCVSLSRIHIFISHSASRKLFPPTILTLSLPFCMFSLWSRRVRWQRMINWPSCSSVMKRRENTS